MENNKNTKVALTIVIMLIVIITALVASGVTYNLIMQTKNQEKGYDNYYDEEEIFEPIERDANDIYARCEKKIANVEYKRETGGTSGFFIKDGVVYSGQENLAETHKGTIGVDGRAKYVVTIDKEVGKTLVLTEDGKLFINKEQDDYGGYFSDILDEYKILEIVYIPKESAHLLLTRDGEIIRLNGSMYIDLYSDDSTYDEDDLMREYID